MEKNKFEDLSLDDKLKLTFKKDVMAICKEVGQKMNLEFDDDAKALIAELVLKKHIINATDVECFAKHAKRNVVNIEDVKLLARRNPTLKEHLNKFAENMCLGSGAKKRKATVTSNIQEPSSSRIKPNEDVVTNKDLNIHAREDNVIDSTIDLT